jgi:hypothetical protein
MKYFPIWGIPVTVFDTLLGWEFNKSSVVCSVWPLVCTVCWSLQA